jgi:hypothetical protein
MAQKTAKCCRLFTSMPSTYNSTFSNQRCSVHAMVHQPQLSKLNKQSAQSAEHTQLLCTSNNIQITAVPEPTSSSCKP